MRPCRIIVVDDSPIFLAATVSFLELVAGIEIVATSDSGREALEQAAGLEPDLVLIDLAMPQMSGLEVARHMAKFSQPPKIIVMTAHEEKAYHAAALNAGADGFVGKSVLEAQLLPMIRTLLPECAFDEKT
jgi:DNA-binding NarL/FixJ family response regulator